MRTTRNAIHSFSPNRLHRTGGFSMIEILVTVVILAVGMLGMAAIQLMSKRTNMESAQRTTATLLAADILERMRINASQLENYSSIVAVGADARTAPSKICSASGTSCSAYELFEFDMYVWEQALMGASEVNTAGDKLGGLVNPTACILTNVAVGVTDRSGEYMVAIAWRGNTALSNPVNPVNPAPAIDPYACGQDTAKYHTTPTNLDNAHRRVIVMNTYISQ